MSDEMQLRRVFVQAVIAAVVTLGLAGAYACGTQPVGVDACRKIEGARCENAKSCGIDLSTPVHRRDAPTQVRCSNCTCGVRPSGTLSRGYS